MPIIHVVSVLISAAGNSQEHLEYQSSRLLCVLWYRHCVSFGKVKCVVAEHCNFKQCNWCGSDCPWSLR